MTHQSLVQSSQLPQQSEREGFLVTDQNSKYRYILFFQKRRTMKTQSVLSNKKVAEIRVQVRDWPAPKTPRMEK